jgi:hypothetical protein
METHLGVVRKAPPEDRRTRTSDLDLELFSIEACDHVEDVLRDSLGDRLGGKQESYPLARHDFNSIL